MKEIENIRRRKFVKTLGKYSTVLILAMHLPSKVVFSKNKNTHDVFNPNLFVFLYPDGNCELVVTRSEMGQGVRTSLSSIIADEMDADWSYVKVIQAEGNPKYGNQNTDGSRSVRTLFMPLREIGASVREILIEAAAEKWGIPVSSCIAEKHYVYQKGTSEKIFYGDLVEPASKITPPKKPRLKKPKDFNYIGKALKGVDVKEITRGTAIFGLDVRLPGMQYAIISRPPVTYGSVIKYDKQDAEKIKGVSDIFEIPRIKGPFGPLGGIAVVADTTWTAMQAVKKLKIDWDSGPNGIYDTDKFMETLTMRVMSPAKVVKKVGNTNQALNDAAKIIKSTYRLPHLAHVSMETPNTVASVTKNSCTIWSPTQAPQRVRKNAAKYLGIPENNVTVHVTLLGGGFGRKSQVDFAQEAVIISKKTGKPVQVVWTRENDIHHDYYHTISAQHLEASLDKKGNTTGWLHRLAFPSISSIFRPGTEYAAPWELASGATNLPFNIPNIQVENAKAEAFIRIGWLRSVCNIFQGFAINVFADELSYAAKSDPLEYRLKLIGPDREINFGNPSFKLNTSRLKNVLNIAAKNIEWGRQLPKGYGMGLAVHYSFLSYIAAVALVKVDQNKVTVEEISMAVDCGQTINTDTIKAQMEGSAIFGMSLAFYGKISVKNGVVQQNNFNNFLLARMPQSPKVNVQIVKNHEAPTGIGEPGVPVIAPAIVNAIYAVTGKRYRDLPLSDHQLTF